MTKLNITRKQSELLQQAEKQEPVSIYQLAKYVGRPYRRVHDHIQHLAKINLVSLEKKKMNNRNITLVISNNIYYQRLLRLDDMYAAHQELST